MAIPDNYIDKFTKDGESRMISPAADKVRVENEHYEGDNLDDVLDEIADAIDEAGSGDGTVKGVKVGSTTYEPDSETGVVDLSTPIAGKVDKVPGKDLSTNDYTDADQAKLQALPTADGLTQQLNSKANASEVYSKSEVNQMVANAGSGAVSVGTNGNGTVDIHVGEDTYTINLNHTHENMAKLEKHTPATLPDVEDMEEDTIYAEIEDDEVSVLYIGGVPFYGGGGGGNTPSGPFLRRPSNGDTIQIGDTSGGTATYQLNVKGKNLSQDLTVELDGTGYSFGSTQPTGVTINQQAQTPTAVIDKDAANSSSGVDVNIVYSGSDTDENATAAVTISSSELDEDVECTLIANKRDYEELEAVKFTRQQVVDMGFVFGTNTKLEIDMKFSGSAPSTYDESSQSNYFLSAASNASSEYVAVNSVNRVTTTSNFNLFFWIGAERSGTNPRMTLKNSDIGVRSTMVINNQTKKATFNSVTVLPDFVGMTADAGGTLFFGGTRTLKPYVMTDIVLYGFKHYESGVLVHDFIPRKKNGVVGLYDNETGAFISSATQVGLEPITLTSNS